MKLWLLRPIEGLPLGPKGYATWPLTPRSFVKSSLNTIARNVTAPNSALPISSIALTTRNYRNRNISIGYSVDSRNTIRAFDRKALAPMDNWNDRAPLCGNCRHWPLSGYQFDWDGCEPLGTGGHSCDGTVSDCRLHAPIAVKSDRYPSETAMWPTTRKTDHCGDFELRPVTHRRDNSPRIVHDEQGGPHGQES